MNEMGQATKAILELAVMVAIAEERRQQQRRVLIGGFLISMAGFWVGYLCHYLTSR